MKYLFYIGLLFCLVAPLISSSQSSKETFKLTFDSLLKKHRSHDPIILTNKGEGYASCFLFYKKNKKWNGVLISEATGSRRANLNQNILIKEFLADTIVPRLFLLGLDNLKQCSNLELSNHYNEKMKASGNKNIDYDLPDCSNGTLVTISNKNRSFTYSDCVFIPELADLPEIRRFDEIARYILGSIYPVINK